MGYLPRDLLMSEGFVRRACAKLDVHGGGTARRAAAAGGCGDAQPFGDGPAAVQQRGAAARRRAGPAFHKTLLPTYDVFDEDRYFEPAARDRRFWSWTDGGWASAFAKTSGTIAISGSGAAIIRIPLKTWRKPGRRRSSTFRLRHSRWASSILREEMLGHMARKYGVPLVIVNQVGGNDDLIFDGRSAAFDAQGRHVRAGQGFDEDVMVVDLDARHRHDRRRRFRTRGRDLERAGAGRPRLRPQNAFRQGAAGTFRRHRFGAHGGHRRRRAGPGERAGRDDAVALFERRAAWTIPWSWRATWAFAR